MLNTTVFLNGEFVPAEQAKVSVFDRGFLFGDGIYEVVPIVNGVMIDRAYFLQRLESSLDAIGLAWPCSKEALLTTIIELVRRNKLNEGYVYLQVTRGVAERDFAYPDDTPPTFMAFVAERRIMQNPQAETGVDVVTVDDLRWKRRDIKSLNLLGQCMAKQQAKKAGASESWMVEDGFVTEGSSSSAFIVKDNCLITRPLSRSILPGIRRRVIMELLSQHKVTVDERPFSVDEALNADEAFLSSATTLVLPIRTIDGQKIGSEVPGPVTRKLRELYLAMIRETANPR